MTAALVLENAQWSPPGPDGRMMVGWLDVATSQTRCALFEPTSASPAEVEPIIGKAQQRLPCLGGLCRSEEAQTFRLAGISRLGSEIGLLYNCTQQPVTLRDYITTRPKPDRRDRLRLALAIATKVRSLEVHFDLRHPDLRADSFVFIRDVFRPAATNGGDMSNSNNGNNRATINGTDGRDVDLSRPFILDWSRRPTQQSIYQHPRFRPPGERPNREWTYQVFALLMILSEIAAWDSLATRFSSSTTPAALQAAKEERFHLLKTGAWQVFPWACTQLEQNMEKLEQYDRWHVKRFYDMLCDKLQTQVADAGLGESVMNMA
ncbi:hypothetical protein MCOR27_009831 [Pyricularia oryzae]|uniref:Protein kinase domain-containing protein n=5 Tax=Pyricularia TaxID=48558 RepID=A0ABQ8P0W1_PYRGI|nr:uncharacterized protein MGG_04688 [Pyricularia oryzae 70-15]ELQ39404.1 hypothetical protein OOU_Y34scaffold00500g51 [Pyricularia oryzae Y34]KAH8844961.1 hypothetical protein MCOR01_002218 [Pyricularia oryzae]KAI6304912.1 hypothetical protein MCOR33_000034 [Pyricularia grisea]EHA58232.1 hypothetical protein MGG_04688 [Pyricularia oryzae 70-15]KAH9429197.1 hypothetical protein MCOR02_010606 [Pyricularia oryzae]